MLKTPNASDFEKAPEGMHIARCYGVIDLGTHLDKIHNKNIHKVRLMWETPKRLMKDGKPFQVNKQYTLSHHEKSILRGDLESWYGKRFSTDQLNEAGGFDLEKVLGRPCMLNVVHSEDGKYANVDAVTPLVEGLECPPQINQTVAFSFQSFSQTTFSSFSEKMQKYLMDSEEYQERIGAGDRRDGGLSKMDDDIPFS